MVARCGDDSLEFPVTVCPIDQWLAAARAFYGPAIDFDKVRVKASRLVFGPPGTGWTCNNVVRFKRATVPADLPQESTLIHELGHVWEHQSGQAQVLKGMVEQTSRWFHKDPYDYGGPAGAHAGVKLTDFKKEGQAEIIRCYWLATRGFPSDMKGVPLSTPGYTDDLRRLVEGAGIGAASRRRRTVSSGADGIVASIVNFVVDLVS